MIESIIWIIWLIVLVVFLSYGHEPDNVKQEKNRAAAWREWHKRNNLK